LTINGEAIDVEKGSYSWRSFGRETIADSPAPPMLVRGLEPKTITPGAELKIKFSKEPNKMALSRWVESDGRAKEIQQIELKDHTFTMPNDPGQYIYSLRSEWNEGGGNYAFVVLIH